MTIEVVTVQTGIRGPAGPSNKTELGLGNVTNDAQTKADVVPNTAPAAGQILVGNAGGTAYVPKTLQGDVTIDSAGSTALVNKDAANGPAMLDSNRLLAAARLPAATALAQGAMPTTEYAKTAAFTLAQAQELGAGNLTDASSSDVVLERAMRSLSQRALTNLGSNIALGCTYTCTPGTGTNNNDTGSYADDHKLITDGVVTASPGYNGAGWKPAISTSTGVSVIVDLGVPSAINRLRLCVNMGSANVGCPQNVIVSLSQDNTNWYATKDAYTSYYNTAPTVSAVWLDIHFPWSGARYVKINLLPISAYASDHWFFVDEVEIYGIRTHASVDANLIWSGDSLTDPGSAHWAEYLVAEQIRAPTATNRAVGGKTIASLIDDDVARVDALFDASKVNVLFFWAGTNDLYYGATAAQTETLMQSYCEARKTANPNMKILVSTIAPRSNSGTPGDFETSRQTFNTWLRANYATFADGLFDVGGHQILGAANAQTDTHFYWDLCHMQLLGQQVAHGIAARAYCALLNTLYPG